MESKLDEVLQGHVAVEVQEDNVHSKCTEQDGVAMIQYVDANGTVTAKVPYAVVFNEDTKRYYAIVPESAVSTFKEALGL